MMQGKVSASSKIGRVAEVEDLLELRPLAEEPAQGLAVAGPQPLVGDDVAELSLWGASSSSPRS